MQKLTDREINIAAARYAGVRMLALVIVLGLNFLLMSKFGYDLRNWEWWAISPISTIGILLGILFLDEAIGGIR